MRAFPLSSPLPWTDKSLYDWFTSAIKGVRHRTDIPYSYCCDPAGIINIQASNLAILQSNSADTLATYMALLVHEARHNEGLPHTCGTRDQTLNELGAWGVQFHLYERMAFGAGDFLWPKDQAIGNYRSFFWNGAQMVVGSDICDLGALVTGSPRKVDFGTRAVGSSPPARTVVLSEVKGGGARVGAIGISGTNAADFSLGTGAAACEGKQVSESCSFPVSFRPSASGLRTATLRVAATATAPAITVDLAGTGGREACGFTLSPVNARFAASSGSGSFDVRGTEGCTWTAASSTNWLIPGTPTSGSGSGKLTYTVQPNTTGAPRQATITAGGATFAVSQNAAPAGPRFAATGVVNAASYAAGITPGGLATIYGTGIVTVDGVVSFSGVPIPRQLAASVVEVDGAQMPITAVARANGAEQINFQAPYSLAGRTTASLAVIANGVRSPAVEVPVYQAQPGLFTMDGSSGAILHGGDYSLVTRANPAAGDEWVVVYLTGLGTVTNQPGEGEPAPGAEPLARTRVLPVVTMGGIRAELIYSGLAPAYVGLYQLNVKVPQGVHGAVSIDVTAAGVISRAAVMWVR
jgi:uncharacterized protein (TIGR03437 family)